MKPNEFDSFSIVMQRLFQGNPNSYDQDNLRLFKTNSREN